MKPSRLKLDEYTAPAFSGISGLILALAASGVVHAADTGAAPTSATAASGDTLEEVTVTAQRRVSTAQTTPVPMSVYSPDALAEKGVVDVASLANADPSINYTSTGGLPTITIRGVASHDTSEVGDPAVAVATDGFFLNRPYSLASTFYDLDRIEVLRGPQGTLYGRNAIGGVINVITAKPGKEFGGDASLEIGNYNAVNFDGAINLPLSDTVQLRAAFSSKYHDGYRNNAPQPDRGDDEDSKSGRITLAFQPFEHFSGLVSYQYLRVGGVGQVEKQFPFVYQADGVNPVHTQPSFGDTRTFPLGAPYYQRLDDKSTKWNFSYDGLPGGATVTYLGGYDDMQYHRGDNNTGTATTPHQFIENEFPKTQNHELRLTSADDQRLTWLAGLFFFKEQSSLDSYDSFDMGTTTPLIQGEYKFPKIITLSRAIYGQSSFKVTDEFKITGGVRYTSDTKTRYGNVYNNPQVDLTDMMSLYGDARSTKVTWHGGMEWNPTSKNMVYFNFDTGYKAGGFSVLSNPDGSTAISRYAPETAKNFEIGSKNRFFDDTVEANASVFYELYKNQQVQQAIPNTSLSSIQNAGGSKIYGLETQLTALVNPVGKFDLSASYLHARFTDFLALNATGTANQQLAGNTLPQSPTWSIGAGLEHGWNVAFSDAIAGTVTGRIETKFQTAQNFGFFNYPSTQQKAYAMSNANLKFAPRDAKWNVQAYIRNIEDKNVLLEALEDYNAASYTYAWYPPRTYGVRLEAKW